MPRTKGPWFLITVTPGKVVTMCVAPCEAGGHRRETSPGSHCSRDRPTVDVEGMGVGMSVRSLQESLLLGPFVLTLCHGQHGTKL